MTVINTTTESNYVGNGMVNIYPIGFDYIDEAQVFVYLDGVLKTNPAHYSIIAGDVHFLVAPLSLVAIKIARSTPATQDYDYLNNGAFPAEVHEKALDKLTMIVQEQNTIIADLTARIETLETP